MENERKTDLEDRLVRFAAQIVTLVESIQENQGGRYIAGQLIRSGLAPALNYGEAKGAESSSDFIHKMKIALKELRESFVSMKILKVTNNVKNDIYLDKCLVECNELISIFVKSIQTAEKNRKNRK